MDNGACSYRRFLNGDESAFEEIMKDYFNSTVFFINTYVHDTHVSEDIAIDVFSDLVVNKRRYNFKVSLKTYLFMLARSKALNYLKRQKIVTFTPLDDISEIQSQTDLEDEIFKTHLHRELNHAIGTLPKDMQTVVHLIYFEDLSYTDTAKVMKKTKKQVDNLLYRAKKELRTILGKDGENIL